MKGACSLKVTNNHNLPEPIVKAVSNHGYTKAGADYSATELLNPIRLTQLRRRHDVDLVEDASERIWSLMGSAIHTILSQAKLRDHLQEETLFLDVLGRKVKGQPDLYADGKITDYKVTSVWVRIFNDRMEEWEAQVNIYAELYEAAGFEVRSGEITCIYRDWSERELQRDPGRYPKAPAECIPIKIWDKDTRVAFLRGRVALNIDGEKLADDQLPPCTDEEMWAKRPVWAVMKEGRKSALKLFDKESPAAAMAASTKGLSVEHRPGERTRCEKYCPVSSICQQFKAYKSKAEV